MEGIMHNATLKAHTPAHTISATAAFNWVVESVRIASQRRSLAKLSWSALDDIGVTEAQAMREAHKPFWA
ncbi:hypothetical protein A9Q96_07255 [Rhodobacterales bacterium 52_120_T64]|nr:hypothetical protein A9Q96_07255 [Rhodobacterales bacterium 52_120_T64]